MNAFKNLASVGIAANYEFKELDAMKSAAKAAPASGGGGGAAAKPAAESAPAKDEEPEDDGDMDMGDLFGGGEDDY